MNIVIFSFSQKASELSVMLNKRLTGMFNCNVISFTMKKYAYTSELNVITKGITEIMNDYFKTDNVIIFVSACGIAVRSISPFVKDKTTDPCVIVIDELGRYVISLLSGHIGGGNEYTNKISEILNAIPVITTATDINNKFAIDVFAKKNNLHISNMHLAKNISAAIIHNRPVGIITGKYINITGSVPTELHLFDIDKINLETNSEINSEINFIENISCRGSISCDNSHCNSNNCNNNNCNSTNCNNNNNDTTQTINNYYYDNVFIIGPFNNIDGYLNSIDDCNDRDSIIQGLQKNAAPLYLIPKQAVLGIGCKRGTDTLKLSSFVRDILDSFNLSSYSIAAITSIDIKKNEPALIALADEYKCDFITYDSNTLKQVNGNFSSSEFVASVTGVDNVCERSALCYSKNSNLFLRKYKQDGMTIAIAFLDINILF